LERDRTPVLSDFPVAETEATPFPPEETTVERPPLVPAEIVIEDIARQDWKPLVEAFPTLSDRGSGVEQFRGLRSHVYQARYEAPLKSLLIASGLPSEGKSFVAANLAVSMARNSIHNILLIDGDLRRPMLHTRLGAPNQVGLSEYLEGKAEVMNILQRDRDQKEGESNTKSFGNLTFIPSGKTTDHSTELLAGDRMKDLIKTVAPYFDWIIIDAPPVLAVTDAVELSRAADAVMLVARSARTPYEVAQRTQAAFGNLRVLGFVLNDMKDARKTGTYSYNYNYNYYYGNESEAEDQTKRANGR
jgi:capsular exopolysaccharide synthesis family protein